MPEMLHQTVKLIHDLTTDLIFISYSNIYNSSDIRYSQTCLLTFILSSYDKMKIPEYVKFKSREYGAGPRPLQHLLYVRVTNRRMPFKEPLD